MPTRDTCLISFNLGDGKIEAAEKILRRAGLEDAKGFQRDGVLAGYCSIELPVTDPRLDVLIRELDASQKFYTVRAERRYGERELDQFPWLVLRVNTAGLSGGVNLGQAYDHEGACATCGAGSIPIPPLLAATARMGKKAIDCTAHDGHHIVTTTLGDAIHAAGLTGFVLDPVSRGPRRDADPAYRWLRIVSDWSRLSPKSVLKKDDLCPACGRAGHYDPGSRPTEYWCDSHPSEGADFNQTWEYFGRWRMNAQDVRPHVGGLRRLVVSQRVRSLFKKLRVRRVSFEPVFAADTPN